MWLQLQWACMYAAAREVCAGTISRCAMTAHACTDVWSLCSARSTIRMICREPEMLQFPPPAISISLLNWIISQKTGESDATSGIAGALRTITELVYKACPSFAKANMEEGSVLLERAVVRAASQPHPFRKRRPSDGLDESSPRANRGCTPPSVLDIEDQLECDEVHNDPHGITIHGASKSHRLSWLDRRSSTKRPFSTAAPTSPFRMCTRSTRSRHSS
eukprot:scaffold693_cov399-Prasinococcus_capsulatus_cf.AAC.29